MTKCSLQVVDQSKDQRVILTRLFSLLRQILHQLLKNNPPNIAVGHILYLLPLLPMLSRRLRAAEARADRLAEELNKPA